MRTLLAVYAAAIAILAIVSATLWGELSTARQDIADLKAQAVQVKAAGAEPVQALQPPVEKTTVPAAAVQNPEPMPVAPAAPPPPVPVPVVIPLAVNGSPPVISEARRAAAMADSDQTATARVLAWRDRLAVAGLTLTTEQLQALNTAALAQMRRETQENLELETTTRPTDLETVFRLREEAINRQNETNLRVLRIVTPELTEEQARALRAQFDSGHAARLKSFQAEKEQIRQLQPR